MPKHGCTPKPMPPTTRTGAPSMHLHSYRPLAARGDWTFRLGVIVGVLVILVQVLALVRTTADAKAQPDVSAAP